MPAINEALYGAKLFYTESPTSWTMEALEVGALAKLAHKHGALVAIDNSWASPIFQKPIKLGVDIVIHTASKYLGRDNFLCLKIIFVESSPRTSQMRSLKLPSSYYNTFSLEIYYFRWAQRCHRRCYCKFKNYDRQNPRLPSLYRWKIVPIRCLASD